MENYASIQGGVSRDFIVLTIQSSKKFLANDLWSIDVGESLIKLIGFTLVQVNNHNLLYDYEKESYTTTLNE